MNTAVNHNDPVSTRISPRSVLYVLSYQNPIHTERSVSTPNTILTFGMPNLTTHCPARVESPCGSVSEASSRSNRYSVAEQALSSALKNSEGERSPLELQINALQQATVTLSTRAKESRERAAKLKLSLTARDTEPSIFVALQQERWKEEKRQFAVDEELEVLTQHLTRLRADRGLDKCRDENHDSPPALNNEAKRCANLAHFFDYSPTRTSFDLNFKCRLALDQPFPRRMSMSDVSPLRLRPSSIIPLRRLTIKHARSASMAGEAFNPTKRPCRPRPGYSPSDVPSLTKGTENSAKLHSVPDRSVSPRSSRLTAETPSDGSEGRVSTRPSTPPLSVASGGSSSSQSMGEDTGGIATIISHVTSRTRSEILADLDQDAVHVPDYAVNLLGGLDLIHDEFTLPDREMFIKPREMKPIEVAPPPEPADVPPPSEESDTGPYTSFALSPFTVEDWSRSLTNSPSSPSTPRMQRPSLQPLTPDSSSFSRSSTPTTPRPSQSSKGPRARHSLLFYMRKHRENSGEHSPASSSFRVESLPGNSPVAGSTTPKKRFSFFSRK